MLRWKPTLLSRRPLPIVSLLCRLNFVATPKAFDDNADNHKKTSDCQVAEHGVGLIVRALQLKHNRQAPQSGRANQTMGNLWVAIRGDIKKCSSLQFPGNGALRHRKLQFASQQPLPHREGGTVRHQAE